MFRSLYKAMVHYCPKRYAGHSKWANIRHIKAAKDAQKSMLFVKFCQRIKLAIHEGGSPNPDLNLQLAQVIEIAKKQNMPSSSIQNCIKSAESNKNAAKSIWFEIKGPGGCFIIASLLTDNMRKSRDTIAPILRKCRASFADRACKHLFHQKGEVVALPPTDLKNVDELCVDHAIDCGAEEVLSNEPVEGAYKFICELNQLNITTSKLQGLGYTIKSSDWNFIPTVKVQLTDEDMELTSKLMEKLEEHPDVVALYDNIA